MSVYDYEVTKRNGETLALKDFEGKVMVIVNTATGCGFTPQYEELENLYEKYHEQGLEIIDVPCNQFAGQTPGTDEEVHEFCTLRYHTQFDQMKKSNVNGADELPLYTWLKSQKGFAGFGKGPKALAMGVMLKGIDKNYMNEIRRRLNFEHNAITCIRGCYVQKDGEIISSFTRPMQA
ncbi:MAG: redoxin domain-containing protein, partial [Solobacterium sp.]|nr:redoxin domain-containing protein [Solobacterium sp.]